ncbi:MAG: tRNA (adenosine(37)-N6)-threonylcarbamoyltransferase complex ATPase subunit type 1 TsaE [Chloroflexi bacterium]|nr:tRNA (adenosine(37)-N6)-threonylcarbamoyltransferase complex ATPase subunit type 1 TsaE [Chloroflexota bacterium]
MVNVIIAQVTDRLELSTHSPAQTQQIGNRLGQLLQPGDVICLAGELGAGKTTLVVGIGHGWGALEAVNSPTFVFVNEYSNAGGGRLYHVDAYRLRDAADAESIGLPEMLNDTAGTLLIEWPERALACLPPERLWIELTWTGEETRALRIEASGERYRQLIKMMG